MHYRAWTLADLKLLEQQRLDGATAAELAVVFQRTVGSIRTALWAMGVYLPRSQMLAIGEAARVCESAREVASMVGCHLQTVYNVVVKLREQGWDLPPFPVDVAQKQRAGLLGARRKWANYRRTKAHDR